MKDLQKTIFDHSSSEDFIIKSDTIHFKYEDSLKSTLSENSIEYEHIIPDNKIIVNRFDFPFGIFMDTKDYLKISNLQSNEDILILNYNSKPISKISGKTLINFKQNNDNYFFSNSQSFVDFIDFLKSKDTEEENAFHFIDYFNSVYRKIVMTSIADKSRIIIKFRNEIPFFNDQVDYSSNVKAFKDCFEEDNIQLPKFLKASLIKASSRFNPEERIKEIFLSLQEISNEAKINFEVYLNKLSIDKIKKDYDDYRSNFFSQISDILKKLTQKIIGYPLIISSSLFALEKIKANDFFLIILAIALIVTTGYLVLLLKMNFKDLFYLSKSVTSDFEKLKHNDFFKKFSDELKSFKEIKDRITNRIKLLYIISEAYYWILGITNSTIVCTIIFYVTKNQKASFMAGAVLLFILIIVRNNIKNKNYNPLI